MALFKDFKLFQQGGLNRDDSIEYIAKNDFLAAYNLRVTGTAQGDGGLAGNIESNIPLTLSQPSGINRCIGSKGFETLRIGIAIIYNSAGYHQIREINYDSQTVTAVFTNLTDSSGISVFALDPQHYVDDIDLIADTFLLLNDAFYSPKYINYTRLKAGGYGTLVLDDFSLIQAQPQNAITASYSNDASRSVNLLVTNLFQFRSEYIKLDYEYTAWSTISELFVPTEESTPEVGTDVTINNNLIVSIPNAIGHNMLQLRVGAKYGTTDWFVIKLISAADLLLLPAAIDIGAQVYEAYDPITNVYTLVFYNDGLYENVPVLQTDQLYDTVPLVAGASFVLNGNETALADITIGYDRPNTLVTLAAVNYNPNLTIPTNTDRPLQQEVINSGQSGSGQGNHRRLVQIEYRGIVKNHDTVTIVLVDIRNAAATLTYVLTCNSAHDGNTVSFIMDEAPNIPGSSTYIPTVPYNSVGIYIVTPPYYTLQTSYITLFNSGAGVFKSIHALKSNSSYQLALAYYDAYGRPFPIQTGTNFVIKTNSYAQSHGQSPSVQWTLSDPPPTGATSYQWLLSKNNTHQTTLFMYASIIAFQGTWNATTNTPTLAGGTGTVGHAYEIVQPSNVQNLGNGVQSFNSGDFVVYNGTAWDIVPKSEGDLSSATSYYFYLNALANFNQKNSTSVLSYDYTVNDRCTLLNYIDSGTTNWFDGIAHAIADVQVQGYNPANLFLKVNTSSAIDPSALAGKDVLLEIYTPRKRSTDGVLAETVYYEIGTSYPITDGAHSVLAGTITQGDVYFKTREIGGSVDPNTLYTTLVEDFNFADFYPSEYTSYGRQRSYSDTLERTEQVANIVYSETYIIGSKVNGLTKYYAANIYGEAGGQTSSNYGRIRKGIQINNELVILQDTDHGSIPVYINIIEDQVEQQNVAISEKILGNIRYTQGKHIGIGNAKESVAVYNNIIYWIDPHRSEPIRWSGNGALPISDKLSKYFKQVLQSAYALGLKIIGWYDIYYDEYIISIQQEGGVVTNFAFAQGVWRYLATYSVLPADITIESGPTHSSASYNNLTGDVVLTPNTNYVGSDTLQISFSTPDGLLTKNACFNWTMGSASVYNFAFIAATGQPLSTEIPSNFISVGGNDFAVPISIVGGDFSINNGAFINTPATVLAGDVVQVQCLSSGSTNTETHTDLTISSETERFSVTTYDGAPPPEVSLAPTITDNDTFSGVLHSRFVLTDVLTDTIFITYSVSYTQGGTTYNPIIGVVTNINSGELTTVDIEIAYSPFGGTPDTVAFDFSPSPNPSAGVIITYTSPFAPPIP